MTMTSPHIPVKPKLLGISGHSGVGKDSAASYLRHRYEDTAIHAFADALKESCAAMFGVHTDHFYDRTAKETPHPDWGVTPRMMAQFVGTELVREHMWKLLKGDTDDFWIRRLAITLYSQIYTQDHIIIIPDVRFQNEYDWIMANNGAVIHLTRRGYEGKIGVPGHKSEAGFDFTSPERTYRIDNDDTLETLYTKVDNTFRDILDKHFFPLPI